MKKKYIFDVLNCFQIKVPHLSLKITARNESSDSKLEIQLLKAQMKDELAILNNSKFKGKGVGQS